MNHSNHFGLVLPKMWRPISRSVKTTLILLLALFLTGKGQAQSKVDSFDPGANARVRTMALQTDGKILVGGAFSTLGGGGMGTTTRNNIGRLNPDGTLDTSFNPGADIAVQALAIQADGKILVGGEFTTLGGGARSRIGRLNTDGTLDTSFDPGADNHVLALAVQADGKILVGGYFTHLGGGGAGTAYRPFLGRLNPDGTLDEGFDPGAGGTVFAFALPADGRILVGGSFISLGGSAPGTTPTPRFYIGRLESDGTVDASFDPGADGPVSALALQADGKVLLGGQFMNLGGGGTGTTPRNHIGRLDSDGTLDVTFDPGATGVIEALEVQSNGKILVGATFGDSSTTTYNNIGRLNPDGTLDATFNPGANASVSTLIVQPDGRILVAGDFTALGGGSTGTTTRNRIGRLATTKGLNISTRMQVLTGDKVLIGGFIITGVTPKSVIVRAVGSSLGNFGVAGFLADPTLELHEPDGTVITNDNWKDTHQAEIEASGLQPSDDLESAIVGTLVPGLYTAIVRGNSDTTGIGLVEAYDLEPALDSQLANISTRGFVDTGDNVMIGGFIVGPTGFGNATVVVRAIGPSLAAVGLAGALQDPTLELHDSNGLVLAFNNDWRDSQPNEIILDMLAPSDERESAIEADLAPGAYTAIVRGLNDTTGIALVEVFNLN